MATIPLAVVRKRLEDLCGSTPPSYTRLWQTVAGGYLPGAVRVGNRWEVDEASLPEVAAYFNMPLTKTTKRTKVAA